jgi:alpha-acetolactate decarboxylase
VHCYEVTKFSIHTAKVLGEKNIASTLERSASNIIDPEIIKYINKIEEKFDSVKIRMVEMGNKDWNYFIKLRMEELN